MEQKLGAASDDRLAVPVQGGIALTSNERQIVDLSHVIPGWGSDLEPHRRPGVPRDAAPDLGSECLYPPMEAQHPQVRIHKSTEHGRLTPVFGTSCPPRGLSGRIRDHAYTYSEGRLARWMLLMLADRVDVVEDVGRDLVRLRPPNLFAEMGLRTELQHNRSRFLAGAMAGAVALGVANLVFQRRRVAKPTAS